MAHVIAVAGKGGVGKTTLCGMLIQYLCEKGKGPILAVDADANSNLNEVLGVEVETTLGDVREEIARAELASENPIPAGMSKADYAERRFEDALVEDDDFDLLVMGRTQGKGCYCFVNGLLQTQLAKYQNNYPYIVVDNEAGMEHISRGVLPSMQTAILVSDDILAVSLERVCLETHLSIPEDLSIISFNNSLFARLTSPQLTSIDIGAGQLGSEAASQIINHIENPDLPATKIIVPHHLIERDSCCKI